MTAASASHACRRTYRYVLLDPALPHDRQSALDQRPALGIEVTVPELAVGCALGNIDPQHGPDGRTDRAAIEDALLWPLPPPGTLLVTIRSDLDALGSMAVLELRADGELTDAVLERVGRIAGRDKGPRGSWPGPRFLTSEVGTSDAVLTALGRTVTDAGTDLALRVDAVRDWLESGTTEADEMSESAGRVPDDLRLSLAPSGLVAVVRSEARAAVQIGYRCAPVVVAENPRFRLEGREPHRKITIAQWEAGWVDLPAVVLELSAAENGWGGSSTVVGSPQGAGTELPLLAIVQAVERWLIRRA